MKNPKSQTYQILLTPPKSPTWVELCPRSLNLCSSTMAKSLWSRRPKDVTHPLQIETKQGRRSKPIWGFFFIFSFYPPFTIRQNPTFDPKSKACAMHILVNENGNIAPFGLPFLTQVKLKNRGFNDKKIDEGENCQFCKTFGGICAN